MLCLDQDETRDAAAAAAAATAAADAVTAAAAAAAAAVGCDARPDEICHSDATFHGNGVEEEYPHHFYFAIDP